MTEDNQPVLVRITKDSEGIPQVSLDLIQVVPGQQVIFMGAEAFSLHFIGVSPEDLKARGKLSFQSENNQVVLTVSPTVKTSDFRLDFDRYVKRVKDSDSLALLAPSEQVLRTKKPIVADRSVELFYSVEIGGKILDPQYKIIDR